MIGSFFIMLLAARFVFRRDLGTSALQAFTIGGPAVPFVGVSVLGYGFGPANESIPVASASLALNFVQLSGISHTSSAAARTGNANAARPSLFLT
jgi:malonate transporter and related proteins